jgi:hypothetical protein
LQTLPSLSTWLLSPALPAEILSRRTGCGSLKVPIASKSASNNIFDFQIVLVHTCFSVLLLQMAAIIRTAVSLASD